MRLFAGQLLMCAVAAMTITMLAEDKAPDLTDAEIIQVVRHVRAGRTLQEEQQKVITMVNQLPEVKQLAAHNKAYQDDEDSIKAAILKAHHLDASKWTVDMPGQRIVPVQAPQPPPQTPQVQK